jgi:hypothetical protein
METQVTKKFDFMAKSFGWFRHSQRTESSQMVIWENGTPMINSTN